MPTADQDKDTDKKPKDKDLEEFSETQCPATHPEGRTGCKLPIGHSGPHKNPYKDIQWDNLGQGQCQSLSDKLRPCLKDRGHTDDHQNGEDTW